MASEAAAGFLVRHLARLRRRFGDDTTFCLMLRVPEPATYGTREVEELADVTAEAVP